MGTDAAPMTAPLDLISMVEAAEIIGVSRQRVGQLADRPTFPAPIGRTQAGRVWLRSDVQEFARRRNPVIGRPASVHHG